MATIFLNCEYLQVALIHSVFSLFYSIKRVIYPYLDNKFSHMTSHRIEIYNKNRSGRNIEILAQEQDHI